MFFTTWGNKITQTISYNHIKIKRIKIIGSKTHKKIPRALNFTNQFALGHQLVRQTYIIHSYNCKDKIKIAETPQNSSQLIL